MYDQVYYSPHLYYMVIAMREAERGGVSGRLVAGEIHRYYEKQNEEMRLVYDKAFLSGSWS